MEGSEEEVEDKWRTVEETSRLHWRGRRRRGRDDKGGSGGCRVKMKVKPKKENKKIERKIGWRRWRQ